MGDTDRRRYMSAQAAPDYGIIDKIVRPPSKKENEKKNQKKDNEKKKAALPSLAAQTERWPLAPTLVVALGIGIAVALVVNLVLDAVRCRTGLNKNLMRLLV